MYVQCTYYSIEREVKNTFKHTHTHIYISYLVLHQAKLDEFYDKVELVKKTHKVEKGHRGQWDIDTSRRHAGGCGLGGHGLSGCGLIFQKTHSFSCVCSIHALRNISFRTL